jgi:hypothetical protein
MSLQGLYDVNESSLHGSSCHFYLEGIIWNLRKLLNRQDFLFCDQTHLLNIVFSNYTMHEFLYSPVLKNNLCMSIIFFIFIFMYSRKRVTWMSLENFRGSLTTCTAVAVESLSMLWSMDCIGAYTLSHCRGSWILQNNMVCPDLPSLTLIFFSHIIIYWPLFPYSLLTSAMMVTWWSHVTCHHTKLHLLLFYLCRALRRNSIQRTKH